MQASKFLTYIGGFAVARTSLFVAPIILANLLSVEQYGTIELAQSIASIGALVMGLGLPASAPLILLRSEVAARWDTLLWVSAMLATLCLATAAAGFAWQPQPLGLTLLVPLAMAVLLLQSLGAATLKSRGRGTAAMVLEAGFWVAAAVGAAWATAFGLPGSFISALILVYGVTLLGWTWREYMKLKSPFGIQEVRALLALSFPLMLAAVLTFVVSSAGRIILGTVSSVETVGHYATLYRATALPLVGHQLLIIGFFRQLYSWDMQILKHRAVAIPFGVTACAFGFWLLVDPFGWLLGERFADAFRVFRSEGLMILSQTVLWSAIALNDLLIARSHITGYVARRLVIYLTLAFVCLGYRTYITAHDPTGSTGAHLYTFVVGHSALMLGYFVIQCLAMWRRGYKFSSIWLTVLAGYAAILSTTIIGPIF